MSRDHDIARFVAASAALTGFTPAELWGTGMVDTYLDTVFDIIGEGHTEAVLTTTAAVAERAAPDRLDDELRLRVLDDPRLGPPARAITMLWYSGMWVQLPPQWRDAHGASVLDANRVISAQAYTEGLVWLAAGAHPQGAKPTGYGSWSLPPDRTAPVRVDVRSTR